MLIWPFSLPHSLSLCSLLLSLKDFTEVRQTRGRLSKRDREGKTERMNEWKMAIIVQTLARREWSSVHCVHCVPPFVLGRILCCSFFLNEDEWLANRGGDQQNEGERKRISLPPPFSAANYCHYCCPVWSVALANALISAKWYRSRKKRRESSVQ